MLKIREKDVWQSGRNGLSKPIPAEWAPLLLYLYILDGF